MAVAMRGLRLRPTYEQLIGVAVSDELRNIKFPNRDATFLRNGFVLSQLDGEGTRAMEHQQEMAAKEAFKESLLKQIAGNTGANLFDLRSDYDNERRTERMNTFMTPSRTPQNFDMTQDDDDDSFDTPSQHQTPTFDYSERVNRRLYFDEEEQENARIREENKKKSARETVSQHLSDLNQPRERVNIDTKVLTRNYLNRVYENVVDKVKIKDDVKREFNKEEEKPSGSGDTPNYPESTHEPKGKRGRPRNTVDSDTKPRKKENDKNKKQFWDTRQLKTVANTYSIITGDKIETKKVKNKNKAFSPNGSEISKDDMIKTIVEHHKTMASQATRGM
jgi:hypothetical protein